MGVAIRVLGAFQVVVDGVDATPAAPKERALLAMLVLNAGHVLSADRIIDELWPGLDPERARHALHVRVAEVRKLLRASDGTSRLEFVSPGYRLEAHADEVDEQQFRRLVERARHRPDDAAGTAATLREALGLWRGTEALGGVPLGPDLAAEAARLADARLDTIEDCVDAELVCGYHQALTYELDRLVAEHPLRERLGAQRVLALYRCGRQAEALRACAAIRRRLADDVGIEPGPALRDLERAVLEQRPDLDWAPPRSVRRTVLGPDDQPPVRYATAPGGVSIAYQVAGDGPLDLVIIPGFTSHLDVWWAPWSGRLARRLLTFCRLIVFDKRGTGLSDRPSGSGIEQWMEDTRVVLDAVGSERPVVLGMSAGGTVGVLFAATYPERTRALILYGSEPCYLRDDDCPWGVLAEEIEPMLERVHAEWGRGVMFSGLCPSAKHDAVLREQFARFQRASASPGAATDYLRALLHMDVRPALPLISAPTLVLHATRDVADPVQAARYMAARIPNAKMVELDSADHLIWLTDSLDAMVNEIQDFAQGAIPSDETTRVLSTVLCIDILPGPSAEEAVRQIKRHRGDVVDNGGGGVLATFDGPARAIRAASAIIGEISDGAPRAGLHCGECEVVGRDVRGVAVSIARELARQAPTGRVLVSRTVRDLIVGSGITLEAHESAALDGVPGDWKAFLVVGEVALEAVL